MTSPHRRYSYFCLGTRHCNPLSAGSKIIIFRSLQNAVANNADVAPDNEQPQRQPSRFESFFSVTRTLIVRALIIYFISNLFRGKSPPVAQNSTDAGRPARLPAANLFQNGTLFVR